jgi:phosphocarrier protein FPr
VIPTEVLSESAVVVGATADTRDEAIAQVGSMLVAQGVVTDEYVVAMRAREEIVSTYLGNGIALPHGTNESKDAVKRTGLAVAQFPDGVPWGDERAYVVIGLAATSDEHIAVLSRLASILGDEQMCDRLRRTSDPLEIHRTLSAPGDDESTPLDPRAATELSLDILVANPHGLHARPAAQIVNSVRNFEAEVTIEAKGKRTTAASITGLLGLGVSTGDSVRLAAHGDGARAALDVVASILTATGGE